MSRPLGYYPVIKLILSVKKKKKKLKLTEKLRIKVTLFNQRT